MVPNNQHADYLAMRKYFPRGLMQPGGSFRFSIDALLLAAFMQPTAIEPQVAIADIGTGCGVVALSFLCKYPNAQALGIEKQEELVDAARHNAALLGFEDQFSVLHMDITDLPETAAQNKAVSKLHGQFSLVFANPPYRILGTGRLPQEKIREVALFGTKQTIYDFYRAAAWFMNDVGRFACIFPAGREDDCLAAASAAGLFVFRQLPVKSHADGPVQLILFEASRREARSMVVMPPLVLYGNGGNRRSLTAEALAYCPELACNATRG